MEEKDSLRTMLYGLARFGLFWLVNIFATIFGRTALLGFLGTAFPNLELYDRPRLLSFFSWLIPAFLLVWLFIDDAKRHTAYGLYNPVAVDIILLLTGAVYFTPVFILDYMDDRKVVSVITNLYFPHYWFSAISEDPQVYGLIGAAALIILCAVSYVLAHRYYLRKFAEEADDEDQNASTGSSSL